MKTFLTVLAGNLVLTSGPQDYPYSRLLMRLCLLVYFATGLPGLLMSMELDRSLLAMGVDILVLLGFVYLCLHAFDKLPRFVQTITALASTGAVLQLVALPFVPDAISAEKIQSATPEAQMSIALLMLMIVIWNLAVCTHIFRQSFGIRLPSAMLLTVSYLMINLFVKTLVMPDLMVQAS